MSRWMNGLSFIILNKVGLNVSSKFSGGYSPRPCRKLFSQCPLLHMYFRGPLSAIRIPRRDASRAPADGELTPPKIVGIVPEQWYFHYLLYLHISSLLGVWIGWQRLTKYTAYPPTRTGYQMTHFWCSNRFRILHASNDIYRRRFWFVSNWRYHWRDLYRHVVAGVSEDQLAYIIPCV